MKKVDFSCPVPLDQQPINEYENLKNSTFFFWTTSDLSSYLKNVLILIIFDYIIVGGLSFTSISGETDLIKHFVFISLIVDTFIILLFIRLYLGWEYIYKRLKKATVSYEESGWYDGQIWIKTPDILIKDRLTADYTIFPIIKRIKFTLSVLIIYLTVCLLNVWS